MQKGHVVAQSFGTLQDSTSEDRDTSIWLKQKATGVKTGTLQYDLNKKPQVCIDDSELKNIYNCEN